MEQQNAVLLAGLTIGVAIVAYILWGPNHQPKKAKGRISGLVNLGSTCFLNTLLQALASCAHFVDWLDQQVSDDKPLTTALQQVLWILNGKSEGNSYSHSPQLVLKVLREHGWAMPAGEQDAHELFHCIVSALQEENTRPPKMGSLSDALPPSDTLSQASDILEDPFESLELEATAVATELSLPKNADDCMSEASKGATSVYEDVSSRGDSEQYFSVDSGGTDDSSGTLKLSSKRPDGDAVRRGLLDRSGSSPPPCSYLEVPPFTGLLASSLTCCTCSNSSSVRTDTFDSISLTLGDAPPLSSPLRLARQTLPDLIRRFVRTEIVPDVRCEKCACNTSSFKTYNFGKLPPCLCFHVGRSVWHASSLTSTKRDDHIEFPEYLVMDPFTWRPGPATPPPPPSPTTARHLYRLKSVVVHVGGANSGHFLTYRRGPLSSTRRHEVDGKMRYVDSPRWHRASDEVVEGTTMRQAMDSLAYMLFYEKCSNNIRPSLLGEIAVLPE